MTDDRTRADDLIFLSEPTVLLVDSMGSDLAIIKAAKVSTLGGLSLEDVVETVFNDHYRFISYLMRNRHGSPFEHVVFKFLIKAPVFVWREFMRHRIASYNEESGRYKELAGEFYLCGPDRKLVQVGKPGEYNFSSGADEQRALVVNEQVQLAIDAYASYRRQLEAGVAREVARMVLPLNVFSSAYVTINARSLMNFLSLRTSEPDSQYPSFPMFEIEQVARKLEESFKTLLPATHKAFQAYGRVAP